MKSRSLIMFIVVFAMNISQSYAQKTKVSLLLTDVTVGQVLDLIESKTDFRFTYRIKDVDIQKIISVDVSNEEVFTVLKMIFEGTNTSFKRIDNQVFLIKKRGEEKLSLKKDSILHYKVDLISVNSLDGQVIDEEGFPLFGVSVINIGTNITTESDFNGNFNIDVLDGEVLQFIFMGKESEEIIVEDRSSLNVVLIADESSLEEVILTALGIRKSKRALAFAATELEGGDLSKARVTNVGNSLAGKVAGVQVTTPATGPGGSSRVIIRGNSSLSGNNQPLYVVDGIPINNEIYGAASQWGGADRGDGIGNINPDDIETMTVLKGANASALYGSRGVNGVILITTKSGKGTSGIGVEINSNFQFDDVVSDREQQLVYGQGIKNRKYNNAQELLGTTDGGMQSWGGILDGSPAVQFDGVLRPYENVGNAADYFYETGSTFSNTLTLTGGDNQTNFRLSFGDVKNESVVPNSTFSRNNYGVRINSQFNEKFSAQVSGNYIRQKISNAVRVSDFPMNANAGVGNFPANVHPRDTRGDPNKLGANEDGRELNIHGTVWWSNPYWAAYQAERSDNKERFIGNVSLRYDFNDWIYVQGRIGIDSQTLEQTDGEPEGQSYGQGLGSISHTTNRFEEENLEIIASLTREFAQGFNANLLVGGNKMLQEINSKIVSGSDYEIPFWEVYWNTKNRNADKGFSSSAVNSIFYSAEISYKNYLYFTATGRNDWFSTLDGRSQFYPSFGLSSILSDVISLPANISFLKLSASHGKSSGGGSPYQLNSSYSLGQPHNGNAVGSIDQEIIPNTKLTPYLTSEFEIGIDFRLLQNRFGVDATYYNKKTTNDILNARVTGSSGYDFKVVNLGEISNKGVELLVYGIPVKSDKFVWDISFNFGYNKNTVESLLNPNIDNESLFADQSRHLHAFIYHYEGLPYSQVSGYQYLRDEGGALILTENGLPQRDETIGINGIVPFGTGNAPFYGGLNNEFIFKDISLSFLIDYRFGGVMHSGTNARGYQYGWHKNTLEGRENGIGVIPKEDIKTYYKAIADDITEEFIYKSDFVKLREVILTYPFSKNITDKLKIDALDVSVVGRNLWTIHKDVPNVDPESAYNVSNAQGLEFYAVPRIRSYGANLNIKF